MERFDRGGRRRGISARIWRGFTRKLKRGIVLGGSAGVAGHVFGPTQAAQGENDIGDFVTTSEFEPNDDRHIDFPPNV